MWEDTKTALYEFCGYLTVALVLAIFFGMIFTVGGAIDWSKLI
jgi:hypothetical protein